MFITLIFLMSVLVYTWIIYPLTLMFLRTERSNVQSLDDVVPGIAVIIAAYNEEKNIAARLENLTGQDYPQGNISILVGIDGSTDRTALLAKETENKQKNVRVFEYSQRRGKTAVLKDLVKEAEKTGSGIIVFTDANTFFEKDTIRNLTRRFTDPKIGGVCGRLEFTDKEKSSASEKTYWGWESRLKKAESEIDSCLGANGAVYAVRTSLFWKEMPESAIVDDFVIGMKVREQGYKMIFDAEAVAKEELPDLSHEWSRRARIGAGDYQALLLCRRCLLPSYGAFAWMFWSHKVFRWFTPQVMILLLAVALLLLRSGGSFWGMYVSLNVICGAVVVLLFAMAGAIIRSISRTIHILPFSQCYYAVMIQLAILAGFLRFCSGRLSGKWERTAR